METIQLETLQTMYSDGFIEGTFCPTCNAEEVVPCPTCEDDPGCIECTLCDGEGELDYTPPWAKEEMMGDCPVCEGEGTRECGECSGEGTVTCPACEGEPYFEIMWNTLFGVPSYALNLDWQHPADDFAKKHKIAWDNGWLLLEDQNGDFWLAAGSCGYDFTWPRAKTLMLMCGTLPWEYVRELSLGGDVFVSDEWKIKIATEVAEKKRAIANSLTIEAAHFEKFVKQLQEEETDV